MRAPLRILAVSAESLLPGYAAHAHMTAVMDALRARGHAMALVAQTDGAYHQSRISRKLDRYRILHRAVLARAEEADILYLRGHPALMPLARELRRRNKRVVVELNGPPAEMVVTYPWLRPVRPLVQHLYVRLLRSADGIVAITPKLGALTERLAPAVPVTVVGNGVDLNRFRPLEPDPAAKPYAVFFGSLARWHGVTELLDAAGHALWPRGLDLVVAGDGQLGREVEAATRRLSHCRWLGRVEHERMPDLVGRATLGISPVRRIAGRGLDDVSPLKLFEMMACGLPVVASDMPGQTEPVTRFGGGLIYPSGDSTELARAVAQLFSDPALRRSMSLGARAAAEANDWNMKAAAIEGLLFQALGAPDAKEALAS